MKRKVFIWPKFPVARHSPTELFPAQHCPLRKD